MSEGWLGGTLYSSLITLHSSLFTLILEQRMHRPIQFLPPIEKRQLDHHPDPHDRRAELPHQARGGGGGAAGGEDVVDDQRAVVGGQGVVVNLQRAAAVFERVLILPRFPRQ